MRDTWKGLVIGGLTGAAVGGVADALRSRQLAEAVGNVQQRAPRMAHDGVDALEVGLGHLTDVLRDRLDGQRQAVVEPARLVEARVEADDVVALAGHRRCHEAPEVPLGTGDENAHVSSCRGGQGGAHCAHSGPPPTG